MDAVFSGQAGKLAFLEGAEARVARADNLSAEVLIAREGVAYLFQGCNDVVLLRGIEPDIARAQFMDAWQADRAVRLILLALDSEEESEIREEAADCLETLLKQESTVVFVENQLYSRPFPAEADIQFFISSSKWPIAAAVIRQIAGRQLLIAQHRLAWDQIPESFFEKFSKTAFEERAIRQGAFRVLASGDMNDHNLAILECYRILAPLPNARAVVSEWAKDFKRPGTKPVIVREDSDDEGPVVDDSSISSHYAYENVRQQQKAIIDKMRAGNIALARSYTSQLVNFQLQYGAEYAAKSLCNLAQEAKSYSLHSLQLEWAQRAVDIRPGDAWAHGQAADALIQFSRLDEALTELQLCETYGDAQFAATGRARILRRQTRLDDALAAFRAARSDFSGHRGEEFAWFGSAETLRDMWKFEDALSEYEQALTRFPDSAMLRCGRASVLSDLGDLEAALATYSAQDLRDDLIARNGKAATLRDMGRLQEALDVVAQTIEMFPADPVARCIQADTLRTRGDLVGASQVYSNMKALYPWVSVAYLGYAEVLRDMRRIPEAVNAYEKALATFPFDVHLANGYANIRKVNDELPESLRLYERNVQQFPYDLVSKSGRADLLKRLSHYDDALKAYDEIIRVWPGYKTARNGKAAILVFRGDFAGAEALLPTDLPKTRDDWIGWHIRGMILLRSNEFEKAIQHFEDGRWKTPFARERRYFDGALSVARMRKGAYHDALIALEDARGGLSNVLRFHAYAGMGNSERARACYEELSLQCPAQLIDLRDTIAARFGLGRLVTHNNDNWIFERETEALLQEAA